MGFIFATLDYGFAMMPECFYNILVTYWTGFGYTSYSIHHERFLANNKKNCKKATSSSFSLSSFEQLLKKKFKVEKDGNSNLFDFPPKKATKTLLFLI